MPDAYKVDHALDDIFVWSGILPDAKKQILDEVECCVAVECENEGILLSQVDMKKTLDNIRVVVELVSNKED